MRASTSVHLYSPRQDVVLTRDVGPGLNGRTRPDKRELYRILQMDFRECTFRNCLENSRRPLESTSSTARVGRSGLLRPILGAFGAPILDPFRISKQFLHALR